MQLEPELHLPVEKAGALAAMLIPGVELKIYKGEPHGLTYKARDDLNRDLVAFAKR